MKKNAPNEKFIKKHINKNMSMVVFGEEKWYDKLFQRIRKLLSETKR